MPQLNCSIKRRSKLRVVRLLSAIVASSVATVLTRGSTLTWDAGGITPSNPSDGAGIWDLTTPDWSNGTADTVWQNSSSGMPVFGNLHGAAGVVNVNAAISVGGISFQPTSSGNYNLAGTGSISLSVALTPVTVNSAVSALISTPIMGSGGLLISGGGSLTLAGSNTYEGGTNVSSGTVYLNSSNSLEYSSLNISSGARVVANTNLSTSPISTVTDQGTFTIAAGQSYQTDANFYVKGGTLNILGSFFVGNRGAFTDQGVVNGTIVMQDGTIIFNTGAAAATTIINASPYIEPTYVEGTIPAGSMITFNNSSSVLNLTNTVNNGMIAVLAPNTNIAVYTSGSVNQGTINLAEKAADPFSPVVDFPFQFTNGISGTLNVNTPVSAAGITNQGQFNIAANQSVTSSALFSQVSGTLSINGSLSIGGNSFNYSGGSIYGTINMGSSGTVYFGSVSTATAASFNYSGTSVTAVVSGITASQNVPSGTTVNVQSTSGTTSLTINNPASFGSINVTSANGSNSALQFPSTGLTNHGSITIAANGLPSQVASIQNQYVNAADGIININTNTFGGNSSLYIATTNFGLINVASGQTYTNSGLFNQAGGTLSISGSFNSSDGFYDTGGVIQGTINLIGSNSLILGSNAAACAFNVIGSADVYGSTASQPIPANVSLNVPANTSTNFTGLYIYNPANNGTISLRAIYNSWGLIIPFAGFVNHGIINLSDPQMTGEGGEQVSGLLINAADGVINVAATVVCSSLLSNSGTINLGPGISVLDANGGINISGGTIAVSSDPSNPSKLQTISIFWPAVSVATSALISTPQIGATTSGHLDLEARTAAPIDIENSLATLTVSANIIDGGFNKSGPGSLTLSGFNGFTGTAQISAGAMTLTSSGSLTTSQIVVASGAVFNDLGSAPNAIVQSNGSTNFPSQNGSGPSVVTLSGLNVSAGQQAVIGLAANHVGRTLLVLNSLTLAGTTGTWQSSLDVNNNDVDVANGSLLVLANEIKQGFANGSWAGSAIESSSASGDLNHLTALGIIQNNQNGSELFKASRLFDGIVPGPSDILIKYTYYGDANLDGKVDASDYSLIDSGFISSGSLTGWYNGDFNYDGVINGSDYTLIDNAYNRQGTALSASIGYITTEVASVPEPAPGSLLLLTSMAALRRRSKQNPHHS